jgi:hypothetical protein
MEQTCQGCGRHCPLTALSCERGRRLNGQKVTENTQTESYESAHENFNKHGDRHNRGERGRFNHKVGEHREYSTEEFAALSTDDKILVRLRGLGHTLHFFEHSGEQLLTPLTDEEKSTFLNLLTKIS